MAKLPKVDTSFPGAGCLLCYAAAAAANSALTSYTQTLPYENLPKLKEEMAERIRKKGAKAIVITEEVNLDNLASYDGASGTNVAKKDFSSWKKKYPIDKLVVIEIDSLGMVRTYSSYFPTSDPKAVLEGKAFMVNLTNNAYEWYMPVIVAKSSDGNWDEPPKFPGLTNAYFQTLELGRDKFLWPFSN